ncbi:MAG TPA: circularly permuted type 2 ATP-grasp protein [Lachnospiraceae bacterium]
MKKITDEFIEVIKEDFEENRKSAWQVKDYLEHSTVAYHGRCVFTLHVPKVYSREEINRFEEIVDTTYRIFTKIIREYLNNANYRKQFPFSKRIEELILVPNLYDSLLPIARFDIFYIEENGSFKFCEINTDGTSAMNEDRELNIAIGRNLAYQKLNEKYKFQKFELFDTWISSFMELYQTYEKKVEHPRVAIVDFMEGASTTEFDEFQKRFQARGIPCEICEIRKLTYKDGKLYSPSGHQIDLIYRRAVTSDIEKRWDEVRDFIEAVKNQDVCIMGSFCTQIIHNKWLFKLIKEPITMGLLSKEEQEFVKEHIPTTWLLKSGECSLEEVLENPSHWIIKPLDSYGSKGVFAGIDFSGEEWKKLVYDNIDKDYIVQEYCPPYTSSNIYFPQDNPDFIPYTNMAGLFVYNGKFKGVYSRLSDGGIISSQYNEKAVASLKLQ